MTNNLQLLFFKVYFQWWKCFGCVLQVVCMRAIQKWSTQKYHLMDRGCVFELDLRCYIEPFTITTISYLVRVVFLAFIMKDRHWLFGALPLRKDSLDAPLNVTVWLVRSNACCGNAPAWMCTNRARRSFTCLCQCAKKHLTHKHWA